MEQTFYNDALFSHPSFHAQFPAFPSRSRDARRRGLAAAFLATAAHANNVIVLNSGEATLSLIDETTHQVVGTVPPARNRIT